MVELGADIPTFCLIIIPLVNIYWTFKYSMGAAKVAKKEETMGYIYFILWLVFAPAAMILIQIELNKLVE